MAIPVFLFITVINFGALMGWASLIWAGLGYVMWARLIIGPGLNQVIESP